MVQNKEISKTIYPLLSTIKSPDDLRKLAVEQLPQVCKEVRNFIIDELSRNPGHFASSLGSVELTVALHYVFNTPYDKVLWDVGHQAYTHKILTGRATVFNTNRKMGGISGFPLPAESPYDAFVSGHASNSISAALGMAIASQHKQEKERKIVAVIGDASIAGGLAFEGLNNVSEHPNNLLIILNDNNMAIDHNVGALNRQLVNITTSKGYNHLRYGVYRAFRRWHLIGDDGRGSILRFNNSLKSLLGRHHNLFEGFNIRYFGVADGHDVEKLVRILTDIKEMKGPRLLHLCTVKGKGYEVAEKNATLWHAPGRFDKETGERIVGDVSQLPPLYQDVFGQTLVDLAEKDERVVGITPAMPTGCSMSPMMRAFPDRTFDVGIAEEHAVTFSAGLAKEGMIPFCNIYSTFMQRAFDQLIHDVAIAKIPVIFCLDRAGLVGEDGATHQGVFDLAYLNCIPNMIVSAPMNENYLQHLMYTAYLQRENPFSIRYPRGRGVGINEVCESSVIPIGKARQVEDGEDVAVLSIGAIGNEVTIAIKNIDAKLGKRVAHYDMIFLKPIDQDLLHQVAQQYAVIITVEDGTIQGGLGSVVSSFLTDNGYGTRLYRMAIPDTFIEHATVVQQRALCHIDAAAVTSQIITAFETLNSKDKKSK